MYNCYSFGNVKKRTKTQTKGRLMTDNTLKDTITLCSTCGEEMMYLPQGVFFCIKCAIVRKWIWL